MLRLKEGVAAEGISVATAVSDVKDAVQRKQWNFIEHRNPDFKTLKELHLPHERVAILSTSHVVVYACNRKTTLSLGLSVDCLPCISIQSLFSPGGRLLPVFYPVKVQLTSAFASKLIGFFAPPKVTVLLLRGNR